MSATKQPKYRFVDNIGDINPLECLRLVYVDANGVYPPLLVYGTYYGDRWEIAHVECDRCTMMNNDPATISDNHYHTDKPAWFADRIQEVARFCDNRDLAADLCAMDPVERARAYESLVSYFGIMEFDSYPETMTAGDVKRHYRAAFRKYPNTERS